MIEKLVIKTEEEVNEEFKKAGAFGSLLAASFGGFGKEAIDAARLAEISDIEIAKKLNETIDAINELEKRLEK